MKITNPREFALELEKHLKTRQQMNTLEPKLQKGLDSLTQLENDIFKSSQLCDTLQKQIADLEKDYEKYNFRYGLGDSHSDFEATKKLRSDTWENIYKAKEARDGQYRKISELRIGRDRLTEEVGHFRRKFKTTTDFFHTHASKVSLYSIVTIHLMGDEMTFILLTDFQRELVSLGNLDIYSIDSPLGKACLGKRIEELISYEAPGGRMVNGVVVRCDLPTVEQMEKIISKLDRAIVTGPSARVDLDSWSSNNTRYRKGG